jgi:EAL domain-containing protein (putative c-di-GMP-specific phosphodiesterase class I)
LQEAARVCATLRAAGLPARISVNVSASQLNATPLAAAVQAAVSAAGACLDDFEIEVTESMLMQSPLQARAELAKIKALGVAVALDDFGTGFSSLGQLANLPISRIKMDRAFVTGLPDREDGAALAKTICDLGQRLKLPVVAEGVETASELEFLRQSGCDEIQGYYFARPMPLQDLLLWLRAAGQETPDEGLRYSLGADVTASL